MLLKKRSLKAAHFEIPLCGYSGEMPYDYEIKEFLKKNMAEVIDMMLAEDQEINALELIAKANENKGVKKGVEQGIKAFIIDKKEDGVPKEVVIAKLVKLFSISQEEARKYVEKYY